MTDRPMIAEDIMPVCSACGGSEQLRSSFYHHPHLICRPCFKVWYDPPEECDVTDPQQVGALSLKLKERGEWPWKAEPDNA